MFEICYLGNCMGSLAAAATMMATDLVFYGMTMYTCALYDELLHEVNIIRDRQRGHQNAKWRYRKLRKCVLFHIDILE